MSCRLCLESSIISRSLDASPPPILNDRMRITSGVGPSPGNPAEASKVRLEKVAAYLLGYLLITRAADGVPTSEGRWLHA